MIRLYMHFIIQSISSILLIYLYYQNRIILRPLKRCVPRNIGTYLPLSCSTLCCCFTMMSDILSSTNLFFTLKLMTNWRFIPVSSMHTLFGERNTSIAFIESGWFTILALIKKANEQATTKYTFPWQVIKTGAHGKGTTWGQRCWFQ